jgi:predicted DsbA family dithiol-disulfide isomerase
MDVEIVLTPFELRPDMPEEGYQKSELEEAGHSDRVRDHLLGLAEREGFPMVIPPFLPKTHLALTLVEMARDQGEESHLKMHHAVFGAYFEHNRDIGSRDVLLGLASDHGMDTKQVVTAWDEDGYAERLHQFRHLAMHLGLESTPAALICNELLIGSRPYAVFRDAVDRCLVTPESVEEELADQDEESSR